MSDYQSYRRKAWATIKPVLPIMMLIAIVASLPDYIVTFVSSSTGVSELLTALETNSPNYKTLLSNISATQWVLFGVSEIVALLISQPLALGLTGAAQRINNGEEIGVRNVLDYLPYTLRVIGLNLLRFFYTAWPLLLSFAVTLIYTILFALDGSGSSIILYVLLAVNIGCSIYCIPRGWSVIAAPFLQAKQPQEKLRTLLDRSIFLMRGYRMAFFSLTLSFFGWILLYSLLSTFISVLFSTLIGNMVSMLLASALSCYMTTAQAQFIQDLGQ